MSDIEKAITYLEDAIRNNCKLIPERNKELRKGLCEQNWHFRTAIEALKKQVPRKRTGEKGYSECPLCNTCAIGDYCYKCGQKLNWEGEGEKIARNMFDTIEALQQEIETLITARAEQAEQINRLTIAFYNALRILSMS